jgi:phosphoribosylanthranilate isomerase
METKVKICGICSLPDAEAAVAAGADALGFMFFEGSPRLVDMRAAAGISRAIPAYVLRTGVFVNPPLELVWRAIEECGLNLLQFHGEEPPEFCVQFGVMSMKAFRIKDDSSLDGLSNYQTDAWLLDACSPAGRGGTGEKFNWDLAVRAGRLGRPFFLAGGLTVQNVAMAIEQVRPFGVDVSSGVESAPGRKDPEKMRAFVAAVKGARVADHLGDKG